MNLQLIHHQSPTSTCPPLMNPSFGQITSARIIRAHELNQTLKDRWDLLAEANPDLNSPYFRPEFTQCVAKIRDDVEIAVLRNDQGSVGGFLPFQRVSSTHGHAIGGRMNDFVGIVSDGSIEVDPKWLLDQLNLKRMEFHALVTNDHSFKPHVFESLSSKYIDLSGDFDTYLNFVQKNSSTIRRLPQKVRALRRDIGDIRFEFESADSDLLEQLIDLKRDKFQRTNTFDILSVEWAANLLRHVHQTKTKNFRGILSVLRAGDEVVASHFGMIAGDVLHYWFPVYVKQFSKYSPGLQLMLETCRTAHRHGIRKIDMSYGESMFKDKFCNAASTVSFALVMHSPIARCLARQRYFARLRLKQIPMKSAAKVVLRKIFPSYGKWHFK